MGTDISAMRKRCYPSWAHLTLIPCLSTFLSSHCHHRFFSVAWQHLSSADWEALLFPRCLLWGSTFHFCVWVQGRFSPLWDHPRLRQRSAPLLSICWVTLRCILHTVLHWRFQLDGAQLPEVVIDYLVLRFPPSLITLPRVTPILESLLQMQPCLVLEDLRSSVFDLIGLNLLKGTFWCRQAIELKCHSHSLFSDVSSMHETFFFFSISAFTLFFKWLLFNELTVTESYFSVSFPFLLFSYLITLGCFLNVYNTE